MRSSHTYAAQPKVVVAVADESRRNRLAYVLAGRGCLVTTVGSGYHLIEHLADPILDERVPGPDVIVVGPKLAGCGEMSVLMGLRDLGWATPFVFLVAPNHSGLDLLLRSGVIMAAYEPFQPEGIAAVALRAIAPLSERVATRSAPRLPRLSLSDPTTLKRGRYH